MAESKIGIVIEAEDKATATLKNVGGSLSGLQSKMKTLQPIFKTMAVAGTVAFGALATGIGISVKEAAMAEGAYNKFNSVFKDGADDMLDFVNDLRREMPTATQEIVRLAADMQDLLVPMGLSRDLSQDMTKGFLTLSNQLAAFNDVDPTQVLEAMKSALVGSSEPLRRFGIDARITTLEATALKEGLIEAGKKFADLTPEVRSQVMAQALLKQAVGQSSDAIEGFAANQDSFLRRFQDMQATLKEFKEVIGTIFMPILDEALKKLKPVVGEIKDWVTENPELVKGIVLVTGAIAGTTAAIGLLGIAIGIATANAVALGIALSIATGVAVVLALIAAVAWLATSIKDIIGVLFDVEITWKDVWNNMGEVVDQLVDKIKPLADFLKEVGAGAGRFFADVKGGAGIVAESFLGAVGLNVDDAIITPQGQVIRPAPDDFIIATKDPSMGGTTFNFDFRGANVADKNSFIREVKQSITRSLELRTQGI